MAPLVPELVAGALGTVCGATGFAWVAGRLLVPALVYRAYRRHVPFGAFGWPDRSEGAGSEDLVYQSAVFDCRRDDLVIRGVVPDAPYWMLGAYDRSARVLDGGHLNHRTIVVEGGQFEVRVSRRPAAGRPNWLCVADDPRGLLVFRVLLPRRPVALLSLGVADAPTPALSAAG